VLARPSASQDFNVARVAIELARNLPASYRRDTLTRAQVEVVPHDAVADVAVRRASVCNAEFVSSLGRKPSESFTGDQAGEWHR
jgi:hypothetical protein